MVSRTKIPYRTGGWDSAFVLLLGFSTFISLAVTLLRSFNGCLTLLGLGVFQGRKTTAGPALRLKPITLSLVRTEPTQGEEFPAR